MTNKVAVITFLEMVFIAVLGGTGEWADLLKFVVVNISIAMLRDKTCALVTGCQPMDWTSWFYSAWKMTIWSHVMLILFCTAFVCLGYSANI